ncbi:hypothetical protein DFP72DRAFT_85272 [Ephemerocybe angulata]|uniref:Uncharacterized protein n=1 Tax=Ephemerocybe angulata TaxID=980116 RepID=A0A8H6HCD0_9AGAR|nr:hypothetical protein DFP72DRAFT_85272 [Tulosesus angulatus]
MTSNFLSVQRPPCSGLTPISFTQNLLWRTCSPSALQNVSIHTLEIHDTSSASQRHSTGPQSPMLSMRHVRDFDFVVLQCLLNRNLLEVRHDGWKLLHEGLIQNLNNMSNFLRELGRCISELTQDLILVMGLARTKGVLNSFVSHRHASNLLSEFQTGISDIPDQGRPSAELKVRVEKVHFQWTFNISAMFLTWWLACRGPGP